MFTYSTRSPAYRTVSDELRRLILSGDVSPGQRLASEHDLSLQYGIGRSTVREALRSLASEGLVVTTRGVTGGTFVNRPSASLATASLSTSLQFLTAADALSVAELVEARELVEVPAAALAARRRRTDHLERLEATIPEKRGDEGTDFVSNRDFHTVVIEAVGNRLLEVVIQPVFEILQTRFRREGLPPDHWSQVDADHRAILSAISAGDGGAASDLMRSHLRSLRAIYEGMEER